MHKEFEDTKGVIIIRKSKKDIQRKGPKEKGQKDKQRSTKHTHKTKYRVTRTNYKPGVSTSCSTNDTQIIRFFLIENPF